MNQTYCLIDIGTNNVLLLLAQTSGSGYSVLKRLNRISALGAEMKNGVLHQQGILRLQEILSFYISLAAGYQAKIILIGTSALREAVNSHLIKDWLHNNFQLELKLISGTQEAFYNGLANLDQFDCRNLLLFDIGGGSTEFTLINNNQITNCQTINLGIRRMYNSFGDSAWQQDIYVKNLLNSINIKGSTDLTLVGIGGTATSLAGIIFNQQYDEAALHKTNITIKQLGTLLQDVRQMSELKALELIPFNPLCKFLLLTGGMIVREIIARFSAHSFFVSDRTWQYGVLLEIITGRFDL